MSGTHGAAPCIDFQKFIRGKVRVILARYEASWPCAPQQPWILSMTVTIQLLKTSGDNTEVRNMSILANGGKRVSGGELQDIKAES